MMMRKKKKSGRTQEGNHHEVEVVDVQTSFEFFWEEPKRASLGILGLSLASLSLVISTSHIT